MQEDRRSQSYCLISSPGIGFIEAGSGRRREHHVVDSIFGSTEQRVERFTNRLDIPGSAGTDSLDGKPGEWEPQG